VATLKIPENTSLLKLPPYSPELNPVEHIWEWVLKSINALETGSDDNNYR
jgi:transposase